MRRQIPSSPPPSSFGHLVLTLGVRQLQKALSISPRLLPYLPTYGGSRQDRGGNPCVPGDDGVRRGGGGELCQQVAEVEHTYRRVPALFAGSPYRGPLLLHLPKKGKEGGHNSSSILCCGNLNPPLLLYCCFVSYAGGGGRNDNCPAVFYIERFSEPLKDRTEGENTNCHGLILT